MTMSKRLAQLGAQSALSVAKPRGLASSYGLINRRPFTKDSNQLKDSEYHKTEGLRRDMEKVRMELRSEIEKSKNKFVMELLATKNDFIYYGAGTLVSASALGISVFRIIM